MQNSIRSLARLRCCFSTLRIPPDHAIERSPPFGDRLILRGLKFYGKHGVHKEERIIGQRFEIDLDAWLDLRLSGETDQMEDSVSYSDIYRRVKSIVEGPSHLLLESVASAIASDVLEQYPKISDVRVRVAKPHVAVEGVVDLLGVEIFRSSSWLASSPGQLS